MTDEEIEQKFAEVYPDFEFRGLPLSPYFDIWCYAIEIMEEENNKLLDVINGQDVKIADLEKQIEKMKESIKELITITDKEICKECDGCIHCSDCEVNHAQTYANHFLNDELKE